MPHLKAALEIWRYSYQSARFVFGEQLGDPTAQKILAALRERGKAGMTRTEIQQEVFSRSLHKTDLDRALESLEKAQTVDSFRKTGKGAPAHCYYASQQSQLNTK